MALCRLENSFLINVENEEMHRYATYNKNLIVHGHVLGRRIKIPVLFARINHLLSRWCLRPVWHNTTCKWNDFDVFIIILHAVELR